jgi:uncharacterized membrane protein YfcA
MDLQYSVLGLVVGILVGITGVGGGALVTPVLTLFGISPVVAVGTDLAFAAITKSVGTAVHRAQSSVEWRVAGLLAAGSCPAAALTVWYLAVTGVHGKSGLITAALSVALVLTALVLLIDRARIVNFALRHGSGLARYRAAVTVATGVLLGCLVTLSSIGAGALGATILVFLYPRLPTVRIAGTDIAHAVPLTVIAGGGHLLLGTVNGSLLASLLLGSVPGIIVGSLVSARLPDRIVRRLLALVLLVVGVRFALSL